MKPVLFFRVAAGDFAGKQFDFRLDFAAAEVPRTVRITLLNRQGYPVAYRDQVIMC